VSKHVGPGGLLMITPETVAVQLLRLIERIPQPPPKRQRGRLVVYSDGLFLKALVIMIVKRLPIG
jgi:hypothetical protein